MQGTQLKFRAGDRVRERDGRHEGVVLAQFQNTVRVRWDETGWKTDCDRNDLILLFHGPFVRKIGSSYMAWTPTWEGPLRPDYMAALADLRDQLGKQSNTRLEVASSNEPKCTVCGLLESMHDPEGKLGHRFKRA